MIPYILKRDSVTLMPAGRAPLTLDSTHPNFAAVRDAIRDNDFDLAVELADVASFMERISHGAVSVDDNGVTYGGQPLHNYMARKLFEFYQDGHDIQHYVKFLDNLMQNPSRSSVEELYLFLEAANLPITEDGCFLAYKAVRGDFRDKHSGRFDNSPGKVLTMPRNEVDDVRDRTCSYGFHAAAYQYAKGFMSYGDKMVAVKINPKDVVSVPSDYNNQKLRTCAYTVMFEIPDAADTLTGKRMISTSAYDYDEDDSDNDDDADSYWWETN